MQIPRPICRSEWWTRRPDIGQSACVPIDDLPDDFRPDALSSKWQLIDDPSDSELFEGELRREVSQGHQLWEVRARVVAVRNLRKEVIYWLPATKRWAWVHLTWTPETLAHVPSTFVCESWAGLLIELADAGRA